MYSTILHTLASLSNWKHSLTRINDRKRYFTHFAFKDSSWWPLSLDLIRSRRKAYHQENNIWHLLDGNVSAYLPLNSCTRQQLINRTVVVTLSLTWYLRIRRKTHFTRSGWIVKFAYRVQKYTLTESAGLFKTLLTAVQNSSNRYLLFLRVHCSSSLLIVRNRDDSHAPLKIPSAEVPPWTALPPNRVHSDCFHLFFRCEIFLNILWRLDENFPLLLSDWQMRAQSPWFLKFTRRFEESCLIRTVQ